MTNRYQEATGLYYRDESAVEFAIALADSVEGYKGAFVLWVRGCVESDFCRDVNIYAVDVAFSVAGQKQWVRLTFDHEIDRSTLRKARRSMRYWISRTLTKSAKRLAK